jgi:polyribonucleotide nucleotidyltransferase
VQAITAEPIVGETYEGPVKSTTAFGAFIEIMPGTEGLLHISEMQWGRTEKTEDVVKKGDRVQVKLIERDERGRLRLSRKALMPKPEGMTESAPRSGPEGGNGGGDATGDGGEREGHGSREGRGDRGGRGGGGGRGRSRERSR